MKNIDKIMFPNLVKELVDYAEYAVLENKVRRVHALCIKQRHLDLADKIQNKYNQFFPKSDLATAFAMAFLANRYNPWAKTFL